MPTDSLPANDGELGRPFMLLRRLPPDRAALVLLLMGLVILHIVAVFTENINWDEFVLLSRAADTLRTGQLRAGGRPGLGTLILIPFVDGCSDSIAAIRSARLLWVGFTVALVSGFWTLLARGLETEERSGRAAAFGVALLVLVPAFLRFSIQVRTDQPAIALGLWGGVALLASRRRSPWALLAGMLFGIGFLFSQKAVYVAALAGLLVVGDLFLRRELRVERELVRTGLCLLGGIAVLVSYRALLPSFVEPVAVQSVFTGLGAFAHYRADFGYAFYGLMLPTLVPHLVLLALLLNATITSGRSHKVSWRRLLLAWAILALGIVVGLFHAGALPYFWMTLGLFPAAAIAIGFDSICGLFPRVQDRRIVVGSVWAFLVIQATLTAGVLLRDTQRAQRDSLAFIDRNFDEDQEGYHPERALFCRDPEDPFATVGAGIVLKTRYWGSDRGAQSARLIGEFRQRPVVFILDSYRLGLFPPEVTAFWQANYRRYYESVWLPALTVDGSEGARRELAVLVPGTYRLQEPEQARGPSIRLAGQPVDPGGLIKLKAGTYSLQLLRDIEGGVLVFVVDDPPKPATQTFYKPLQVIGFRW